MTRATLTISSKNYSSWSLRGWLLVKFAKLEFDELVVSPDDADSRKELLSPSILVPCLVHEGVKCSVPCDHVPVRSWPLFRAWEVMPALIKSLRQELRS